MAKVSKVLQNPEESPADFYEKLCKAFRVHTPFYPETPENQCMVNAAFMGQAQGDIRQKLQKLEGFPGKNATELLEIANKIFVNQDRAARKEANQRMKQKAALLAVVLGDHTLQKGLHGNHKGFKTKKKGTTGMGSMRLLQRIWTLEK